MRISWSTPAREQTRKWKKEADVKDEREDEDDEGEDIEDKVEKTEDEAEEREYSEGQINLITKLSLTDSYIYTA